MSRLFFTRIPRIPETLEAWLRDHAPALGVWLQDLVVFLYEWRAELERRLRGVYDMAAMYNGTPTASVDVMRFPFVRTVTFPANLLGSYGYAEVAATGSTTFTIKKNGASIGTMDFAASGTTATFTFADAVTFHEGDYIEVTAPASPDATLSNLHFCLKGTR